MPASNLHTLAASFTRLAERAAAVFTSQLLEGLDFLHRHSVAHRDLKSANVFVSSSGRVQLADFGVACLQSWLPPRDRASGEQPGGGGGGCCKAPFHLAPEIAHALLPRLPHRHH